WHHVVGSVDRAEGTVALYVDGEEMGSASFPANSRGYTSAEPWRIGVASPKGKSHQWFADGAVDQVRMYARALKSEEVMELYIVEQPLPFEKELLVYYPFDAGQLKNFKESLPTKGSVGGFAGAFSKEAPSSTEDRFGEPNEAFFFDGKTNNITSGRGGNRNYILANATEPRALSVWFKPEEIGTNRLSVASLGSSAANAGWELLVDDEEGLIGNWGGGTNYLSGGKIKEGKWHHAVFSYDDTMQLITLYLNGKQLGSFTNTVATGYSSALKIAGPPLAATNKKKRKKKDKEEAGMEVTHSYFHGAIDDVRVYVRNLTEKDVKELYKGEKPTSWFWLYFLVFVSAIAGVCWFLYRKGYRVPAKFMDPVLQRLPQKISVPLARFKQAEQMDGG
ncbi:uncharacterized protein METZ01_LOCUS295633, partial [marine metagenome]